MHPFADSHITKFLQCRLIHVYKIFRTRVDCLEILDLILCWKRVDDECDVMTTRMQAFSSWPRYKNNDFQPPSETKPVCELHCRHQADLLVHHTKSGIQFIPLLYLHRSQIFEQKISLRRKSGLVAKLSISLTIPPQLQQSTQNK